MASFAESGDRCASVTQRDLGRDRVLIYGINYAPELTGVGYNSGEIGTYLAAHNAQVTVVTAQPHYPGWRVPQPYKAWRYGSEDRDGARILRCPLLLRQPMGGIWRLIAPLSFAATSFPVAVWQALARRPHVVLAVEPTLLTAPAALLAARIVGARAVLHIQDLEVDAAFAVGHLVRNRWLMRVALSLEGAILRRFDRIITISRKMAEKIADKGVQAQRITVIRNWVDTGHIYPLSNPSPYRTELGIPPERFVVLYSGNIGAKQGLGVLAEAAQLLADLPNLVIVIAGEGPMKRQLMEQYGHLPSLRFLPLQPYARLNDFLNMANLHVLTQQKGAADLVLPSKIGGMLASGRPIIATAEEGTELATFLKGAADVIVPEEPTLLADAIRRHVAGSTSDGREATRLALAQTLSSADALREIAETLLPRVTLEGRMGSGAKGQQSQTGSTHKLAERCVLAPARRRIVAIGPLPPPVNGYSVITKRMIDSLAEHHEICTANVSPVSSSRGFSYHLSRICRNFAAALTLLWQRPRSDGVAYVGSDGGAGLLYTAVLCLMARVARYRIYLHHHNFSYVSRANALMKVVLACGGPSMIHIFLCAKMRERFIDTYRSRCRSIILSNRAFVHPSSKTSFAGFATTGTPPLCIGLLSNLSGEKGLYVFLDVLRKARERQLNVVGLLAGPAVSSADNAAISRAQLELGSALTFLGPVYGDEKRRFYEAIDVFMFPSRAQEAEPVVVYEAMASGAYVIAFDQGCIAAQIGEGGRVVPREADFVAEALRYLTELLERRSASSAEREILRQRYADAHLRSRSSLANLLDEPAISGDGSPCA